MFCPFRSINQKVECDADCALHMGDSYGQFNVCAFSAIPAELNSCAVHLKDVRENLDNLEAGLKEISTSILDVSSSVDQFTQAVDRLPASSPATDAAPSP